MKRNVLLCDAFSLVLFLPLQPGMRVQRGPDWQWSEQDGGEGHLGTVTMVKEWKSAPMAAVRIKWDDNGNDNTYRYGGENCYDVILYALWCASTPG